ncbi:MAG: hypothetical protein PHX61_07405 [Alphaproteobacteria bacterium]|nr:hypothetical protein [Alphaproteobacteria bacterium]OIN86078.1 MAG: hypothetical protein AUJ12_06995 [Alphaproteobacteria bacterium CG1_02_46_17]
MTDNNDHHYNMAPRRKADFHIPPNHLKMKVGYGGLTDNILDKAQALLENNTADFRPLGEMYLDAMMRGVAAVKALPNSTTDDESMISAILFPAMQLKANGGMFHYYLVTQISDRLIQFLEVIDEIDPDAIEIMQAFHTTIRAILLGQIKGDGGQRGSELMKALVDACYRYFEKHPEKKTS